MTHYFKSPAFPFQTYSFLFEIFLKNSTKKKRKVKKKKKMADVGIGQDATVIT